MSGGAGYNEIAEVYDQARRQDMPHVEWWLARLAEAGDLGPGKRLMTSPSSHTFRATKVELPNVPQRRSSSRVETRRDASHPVSRK